MSNEFESLNDEEIVSINNQQVGRFIGIQSNGFTESQLKVEQFRKVITRKLDIKDAQNNTLFGKGINCQVMKFGSSGWQAGKLKATLVLEFCPDEPPST
ncbi:hypothetical protein CAL7716_058160 [Calothrix sp. PCC 7716]|nr:hypothetical protein CAL7716_058160 [Calothrix sp. PCC 7716]